MVDLHAINSMYAEVTMLKRSKYADYQALDPFFRIVLEGLSGPVDLETISSTRSPKLRASKVPLQPPRMAEVKIQGRAALMDALSGYGAHIKLEIVRWAGQFTARRTGCVVIHELPRCTARSSRRGARYDNRFASVITIENRKIVHWRDYGLSRSVVSDESGPVARAKTSWDANTKRTALCASFDAIALDAAAAR